jgi:hypothetical protein
MTKDRVKLRKPRRAVTLRLWKKEARVAADLRRSSPKGYVEFVRDLAAQNNGDPSLDEMFDAIKYGALSNHDRIRILPSDGGSRPWEKARTPVSSSIGRGAASSRHASPIVRDKEESQLSGRSGASLSI